MAVNHQNGREGTMFISVQQYSSTVKARFSLAFTIGVMSSILLVVLGVSTTYYTFENQKNTALQATDRFFLLSSTQTEEKLLAMIQSVESFVTASSALQSFGVDEVEHIAALLPYFNQSFLTIPWMTAVYVGRDNGSFYMIEAIRSNPHTRKAFSAPEQAVYAVKIIGPGEKGTNKAHFQFYNKDLKLVGAQSAVINNRYDPRTTTWYPEAASSGGIVITRPYTFFTSRQLGITIAHAIEGGKGVVGADTDLSSISDLLSSQKLTSSTQIVIMEENGRYLLSADSREVSRLARMKAVDSTADLNVAELQGNVGREVQEKLIDHGISTGKLLQIDGRTWFCLARELVGNKKKGIYMVIASPLDEIMVDARKIRQQNLLIVIAGVIVAIGFGLYLSRRIAYSLHCLSSQAGNIRDFQLSTPLNIESNIREVADLIDTMKVMQSAINRFVEIARALSAEKQMERVLEMILKEAQSVTGADGGGIGLVSDDGKSFSYVLIYNSKTDIHFGGTSENDISHDPLLLDNAGSNNDIEVSVIHDTKAKVIDDVTGAGKEECAIIRQFHERDGYVCRSLLIIPLLNRQNEVIGLLHLVNARDNRTNDIVPFSEHKTAYVKALSSNAALALDNNRLIRAQKELFDSFVRLIAGAIDTKSPYTGGHCQRVPVIAGMLADAASSAVEEPFQTFRMNEDERYELFIASWLHDCGKVTTPEYVVDKATRLETNYNRIHEIRTRFEVLWRDADIAYYQGIADSPERRESLQKEREEKQRQLKEDFTFLASCNEGGEFMAPEKIERLREIGRQQWERNFDNRIGLSGDEKSRLDMDEEVIFPVRETLLADKPEHILPSLAGKGGYGDNPWGFKMAVPDHRYNLGEIYNLSIAKGTLTPEERYKINDHIVQTITMLKSLPFPKEIRRVPDWAGNHHEKLDGSGYPRSLTGEQLSIPERIMAVADIFEALTAADRPYRTPKMLSECIKIMYFMKQDGHICPDLFDLLLTSGLYREYAKKYMRRDQLDDVDITQYVRKDKIDGPSI